MTPLLALVTAVQNAAEEAQKADKGGFELDPTVLYQQAVDLGVGFAPKLLGAAVVFVVGMWIAGLARRLLVKMLGKAHVEVTLGRFLGNLAYMMLLALVVITALGQLGVPTNSFAATIAAAGLAIGLALQGSLSNFAAGVMLMFFRPFKVGDFVSAAGVEGIVEEIMVFSTRMRTPDNREITVPNGKITSDSITNFSAKDTRRIDLVFGISYGDDIAGARKILEEVIAAEERVLKDPAPIIAVHELADSSVNFVVRPWAKTPDYWAVRWALIENVKLQFDAQGITIPFPQRDVHMHQVA